MGSGSIVVGVDGSRESRQALLWALDEARRRAGRLVVVHAWWAVPFLRPEDEARSASVPPEAAEAELRRFVEEVIGPAPAAGVEVELRPIQGVTAAEALVAAAGGADLLVVGSRGLGGFEGLLLGSVSRQCLRSTPCPLVIVRDRSRLGPPAARDPHTERQPARPRGSRDATRR